MVPDLWVTRVEAPLAPHEVDQLLDFLTLATPEIGGAILTTWQNRGETGAEIAAVVRWLRQRAMVLPAMGQVFDVCGTGGSDVVRYNVSTTTAFVLASVGVPVAKHGNKGSKRPNGSFDLLDALDIPYDHSANALVTLQRETGLTFLFARRMHPIVRHMAPARQHAVTLGARRTIFNLAGPLANPASPIAQLIGVPRPDLAATMMDAAGHLGLDRALVVCGHPGLDEVSVTGPTSCWPVGKVNDCPATLDAGAYSVDTLPGGDSLENAQHFHRIVNGIGDPGLVRMVIVNATVALCLWQGLPIRLDGPQAHTVTAALQSGAVKRFFELYKAKAQALRGMA